MKYIFEVNICTDGDFSFPFVPCGMEHCMYENYSFKKSYEDRDKAIEDIVNICSFLKEQMHTSRDYVREDWNECIDNFIKRLCASKKTVYEYVEECIGGNYDGTEFIFRVVPHSYKFEFRVTDEEYEMLRKNAYGVTIGMVKEAVMALFRE